MPKTVLKTVLCLVSLGGLAAAEIHTLALHEAIDLALKQNSDIVIARLDEQKAQAAVRVAKDPFVPKVYGGSGLAYVSGYPSSIDGAAPSIFQARTSMALFNRAKSFELAEARENARTASIDTAGKMDEIVYRMANLYLDTAQTTRNAGSLELEIQSLERVSEAVQVRVNEGREIPLAGKRAALELARVRQRYDALMSDVDYAEGALALVLGFPAGDRVRAAEEERRQIELPGSEEEAISLALLNNKDIRRLQSQIQAKAMQVRAQHSVRLPTVDLVAQYALFNKSNYNSYFQKFQRNNEEVGASITIPLLIGTAPSALEMSAQTDVTKLRTQLNQIRDQASLDTRKDFRDIRRAEAARDVAKMDLEVAREEVGVLLAQLDEGRATRQTVEGARLAEQEKWIAFYDAEHAIQKAKLNLLKQTGTLQAALK